MCTIFLSLLKTYLMSIITLRKVNALSIGKKIIWINSDSWKVMINAIFNTTFSTYKIFNFIINCIILLRPNNAKYLVPSSNLIRNGFAPKKVLYEMS